MIKIDKTTFKILSELDFDARESITDISKKILLSKKGTEYRIKELENNGTIIRYYPIIDFFRLGFKYNRVWIKLAHTNAEIRKEIEKKFIENPYVNVAFWVDGEYDLGMTFWTRTEKEFLDRLRQLCSDLSPYYLTRQITKIVSLYQYNYPFAAKRKRMLIQETSDLQEIDILDYKILSELNKNARMSATQIASNIKSNYKTVIYRIKELEKKKILVGYRANIDLNKVGYHYAKVFFKIKQDTVKLKEFFNYIDSLKEVFYAIDQIGEYDIDIEIFNKDENAFYEFMDMIAEKYSNIIITTYKILFRKNIKLSYLPYMKEFEK